MAAPGVSDGRGATDGGEERTLRRFNWSTDSPTVAVVETIAEAKGIDPLDVDQLSNWVDPSALNDLIRCRTDIDPTARCQVIFEFAEYVVEVNRDGDVIVSRR